MASKDIQRILYDGAIKLDYKDKAHRYYVKERVDFKKPESDEKAWGKTIYPKGTTTLLGDTLEKNGLMTWPLGLGFTELFGYYDFINEKGERMQGFSNGKGTLLDAKGNLINVDKETLLPIVESAHKAWTRKKKEGADIGSVVHEAVENYINDVPFNIREAYLVARQADALEDGVALTDEDMERINEETVKAEAAFAEFTGWWEHIEPEILSVEELVYSRKYNVSGTFDLLMRIDGKLILGDLKTSNASKSKEAAMPEGINYQYFCQLAIYAMIWEEMGNEPIEDLMIISCRKDGGFTALRLSDMDIEIAEVTAWAKAVIRSYRMADKIKTQLWERGGLK